MLVAERVDKTSARISAKRLLPAARAAGYAGSPRNFRRLVAAQKQAWRADHHRGRRPAVWSPGEHLVIDWGAEDGLHVFCAVLAWCRVRFVRFAADERAETTLAMLAQCPGLHQLIHREFVEDEPGGAAAGFAYHRCIRDGICQSTGPVHDG